MVKLIRQVIKINKKPSPYDKKDFYLYFLVNSQMTLSKLRECSCLFFLLSSFVLMLGNGSLKGEEKCSDDVCWDLKDKILDLPQLQELYRKVKENQLIGHVIWGTVREEGAALKAKIENKIIENNKLYKSHPSDFIHGLLSAHVYKNSIKGQRVEFEKENINYIHNSFLRNWKVHEVYNYPEAGGYYGVSYINDHKKQIVLAHRGTLVKWNDLFKEDSPLKTDIKGILAGEIVAQQAAAYKITKKITEEAQKKGYNLSITGHSLGAWLAELSLYFAYRDFNFLSAKAVTFESPGSVIFMDKFQSNVINYETEFNLKTLNIVNYLSAPNFVNSCNKHVGRVYRVFPNISMGTHLEKIKMVLDWVKKKTSYDKNNLLESMLSIFGHTLDPLINIFDPTTGKPTHSQEILDWPVIKYTALESTDKNLLSHWLSPFPNLISSKEITNLLGNIEGRTIMSLLSILEEIVAGRMDQTQYLTYFKFINNGFNKSGEKFTINETIRKNNEFSLTYEGHYRTREINLFEDILATENKGSSDWYLYELKKKDIEQLEDELIKKQLRELKDEYAIRFKNNIIIFSHTKEIEHLREWLLRLLNVVPEIKKILEDPTIYLSKREMSSEILINYLPRERVEVFVEQNNALKKLEEILNKHQYAIITGLPGSGQNTHALEYAYRQKNKTGREKTIVRWFTADSADKIELGYRQLASEFGLHIVNYDKQLIISLVNSKFAQIKSPILLIFRNVERYTDVQDYLINLPVHVKVLITTRDANLVNSIKQVKIEPFNKEEAKRYIEKILNNRITPEEIEVLLKGLSTKDNEILAFKLSQAITYIKKNPFLTTEECIKNILHNLEKGEEITLFIKFFKKVPLAWEFMQYAAHLDSDFISLEIMKALLRINNNKLEVAIKSLTSLSLIILIEGKERGVKIYKSIQEEVKKYVENNQNTKNTIKNILLMNTLLKTLNKLMPEIRENPENNWKNADLIYLHAQKIIDHPHIKSLPDKAELLSKLGRYNAYILRNFKQSVEYEKAALEIRQTLYKGNHPDIASSLHHVGWAYFHYGDFQRGLIFHQQALKMRQKLYPGNNSVVADSLNALARCYNDLGNFQEAIKLEGQALIMREKVYKKDHIKIASSLNSLGDYFLRSDNLYKAIFYHKQALKMLQKLHETSQADIAKAFNSIGRDYFALGQMSEALIFHRRALEIYQTLYHDHHPRICRTLNYIGEVYDEQGQIKKSLFYYKQALKKYQYLYENIHPSTARALNNVGWAYRNLGYVEKGLDLQEQALEIRKKIYKEPHPEIAFSLDDVGTAYKTLGNLQKALVFQEQALKMREKIYSTLHGELGQSLSKLGSIYCLIGRSEEGLKLQNKALKMRKEIYGEIHPEVARSLSDLSISYRILGNGKKALELQEASLMMWKKIYKKIHPDIASSLYNIGETYQALGDSKKAIEFYKQAAEVYYETFKGENLHRVKCFASIGLAYETLRKYNQAIKFLKQAYTINSTKLGINHSVTQNLKEKIQNIEKKAIGWLQSFQWEMLP